MKIELPPETWVEVLQGRVSRERVAQLANQTTDRKFAEMAQAWLHRFDRNVQLHDLKLEIDHVRSVDGILSKQPIIYATHWEINYDGEYISVTVNMPIPEVALPNNITGFSSIDICYLDNTLMEFLQKLQRIFTNINLHIDFSYPHTIMATLPHLFPLFHGIHSIKLPLEFAWPSYSYFLFNHYPATMRKATVLKYSSWSADIGPTFEHLHFWLSNRRDDGEPRLLVMHLQLEVMQRVIQEIRQRFLTSKSTSWACFFIRLSYIGVALQLEETINNWTTREQLQLRAIREEGDEDEEEEEEEEDDQEVRYRTLLITRSPVAEIPEWLEQRRQWAIGWEQPFSNSIWIHPALCDIHEHQQEEQQPGTSNQQPTTCTGNGGGTD